MRVRARLLTVLLVAALAASACSDDADSSAPVDGGDGDGALASTDTETPAPTTTGPYTSPEQIPGMITNRFNLVPGQCFDIVDLLVGDRTEEQWTVVSCDGPHQHEAYMLDTFPAGPDQPWPGDELFDAWSRERCYAGFEAYVGQIFELSEYRIGFVRPNEANFTHPVARYRTLACYVSGAGGDPTQGSAAGSAR